MKQSIWIMNHYAIDHIYQKGGRHYWIAEALKKDGYCPVVFGCNVRHQGQEDHYYTVKKRAKVVYSDRHVPFVAIPSTNYTGNGCGRIRNMAVFAWNLVSVAKAYGRKHGKPDVILASSVHPLTLVAGLHLAKYYGVKCICEVRDLWPESLVAYGVLSRANPITHALRRLEKDIYKRADAIIFTMEGGYDYIIDQGWDKEVPKKKVFYINNGVDVQQFMYNKTHNQVDDAELNNDAIFKVVYAGSIRKANSIDTLLDVAKLVKNEKVRFLIWGDGDQLAYLSKRVCAEKIHNVIFKGSVEKKYVPYIISKADMNVIHGQNTSISKYGYSANKMFEYLAAGKPILMDISSPYNPVAQCKAAKEIKQPNAKNIADAIDEVAGYSKEKLAKMARAAAQGAGQYDFTYLTKKMEKIIDGL